MIETERLILRKFADADAQDLHRYLSLPEIYAFEPGDPVTMEEAAAMARERSTEDCFFAVALKSTGVLIGHLYFNKIEPADFMTWELGYIFNPDYQNHGYCTEASMKILDYGFHALHAHRIIANCNPLNHASWKVLEKIGMKREGHFRKKAFFRRDKDANPIWHDCYSYGILEREA